MIKHMLALAATAALATAAPATAAATTAASLSVAQADAGTSGDGFFGSPEAAVGAGIFGVILVVGILVAAGVFEDDDEGSISA